MKLHDFNVSIDNWVAFIEANNFEYLCRRPDAHSWSLGQIIVHLIEQTNYYIKQMAICNGSNENIMESMTRDGSAMFKQQSFPDIAIEGPPSNAHTPQPQSREELLASIMAIKMEMFRIAMAISKSHCKGKTKHPGLGYFNASEWWQFAEMHFRHHWRQKQRTEGILYLQN